MEFKLVDIGEVLIELPIMDSFRASPLVELREELIRRWMADQVESHRYVLLTARDSAPPPTLVVATQVAWHRPFSLDEKGVAKATALVMSAAMQGRFPNLLWMCVNSTIERYFPRTMVEELAKEIGKRHGSKFHVWSESQDTCPMTRDRFEIVRNTPSPIRLVSQSDQDMVKAYRGTLWLPREDAAAYFEQLGLPVPSEWRASDTDANALQEYLEYPSPEDELKITGKAKFALDLLKRRYPRQYPNLSEGKLLGIINSQYQKLHPPGRRLIDGRGREITKFTVDDVKRALGRKPRSDNK